ncbi:TonB-dependent receptor [Gallaecimonas sp. GXIMD4217]|uniref:TonB-dependent receptor n=1 Tax=Gallaecimonas sp. GXIMD4217 TaxID=3131927 RepID=UPI00311ABC84
MGRTKTSLTLLALLPALAQANETITVIGRQPLPQQALTGAVTLILEDEIRQSGAGSLAELLRGRAGIQVADSGAGPVLALRGLGPEQAGSNVLVLVDGRRLNSISLQGPKLAGLPLGQIKRIEVLQGSAGVLYGDQAVGGVINIITQGRDRASLSASLGSDAEQGLSGQGRLGLDRGFYLEGGLDWHQDDGYRQHSESDSLALSALAGFESAQRGWRLGFDFQDDDRDQPGPLPLAEAEADPKASRAEFAKDFIHFQSRAWQLNGREQLAEHSQLLLDASHRHRDSRANQSFLNWPVDAPFSREEKLLSVNPRLVHDLGALSLLWGLDWLDGDYEDGLLARRNRQRQWALYGQARWQASDKLSLVAGGRHAEVEDELTDPLSYPGGVELDEDASAWELGLDYRLNDAYRAFLRLESSFRFAKLDEQAYTPAGTVGLKPQTGESVEAGLQWQLDGQTLRLSAYQLELKDEIVFDPKAPAPAGGLFPGANVNRDQSRRRGLNAQWQHGFEVLSWGLDYSYVDAKLRSGDNAGKTLPWVSRHSGSAWAAWQLLDALSLRLDYQYRGSQYLSGDDGNSADKAEAYGLFALSAHYQGESWWLSARIDNLLDEDHLSLAVFNPWGEDNGYPGDGRRARITLGYQF